MTYPTQQQQDQNQQAGVAGLAHQKYNDAATGSDQRAYQDDLSRAAATDVTLEDDDDEITDVPDDYPGFDDSVVAERDDFTPKEMDELMDLRFG